MVSVSPLRSSPLARPRAEPLARSVRPRWTFQTLAILPPILLSVRAAVASRLILQAISLVGIDRGRVTPRTTVLWDGFTALLALLHKSRPVLMPIATFGGMPVAPGLILEPPCILGVDNRV